MLPIFLELLVFVSEYKINYNSSRVYVPPFITAIKASILFLLNFRFACCICVLYKRVVLILWCMRVMIENTQQHSIKLLPYKHALQYIGSF